MRHPTLLILGLAVLLNTFVCAQADDEPSAKPDHTLFLESLSKGLSQARRTKKPVFLWISPEEMPEINEGILRHLFQAEGSSAISEQAIAVRLRVGAPYDKKTSALLRRYVIREVPAFIILSPDGGLLTSQVKLSVSGVLEGLATAREADSRWPAIEAEWKKAKDHATLRRLATAYGARRQWKKARTVLRKILAAETKIEDRVALLQVLRQTGPEKSRASLLQTMLDAYPKDDRWIDWRIELAMVGIIDPLPISKSERLASLTSQKEVLRTLAMNLTDVSQQVQVHSALARAHQLLGETEELRGQCIVIRKLLEKMPARPDLRRQLAEMLVAAEATEEAKTELLRVVRENPKSEEAPEALLELASLWFGEARQKKDLVDSMDQMSAVLKYLGELGEHYPDSPAHRRAEQKAWPDVKELMRKQMAEMAAGKAEVEREEEKREDGK